MQRFRSAQDPITGFSCKRKTRAGAGQDQRARREGLAAADSWRSGYRA
jgi:hypothetical protein